MQYKLGAAGTTTGERLRHAVRGGRRWLDACAYMAAGFVMANSCIFGGISPFGVAFCAAVRGGGAIAAALGAVLGYIVSADLDSSMKYIASAMLVAAAKWLFSPRRPGVLGKDLVVGQGAVVSMVIAFFSMMVAGAAAVFSSAYTIYDLVLNLSEVFLACGAAYFFTRATDSIRVGWSGASRIDLSCVVISFAIIIMGFEGMMIYGVSAGRVLAVLAILLCGRYGGEAGGAVSGVVAGFAMSLAGGELSYIVAAYAFGGLVAGVFGGAGKIATAVSFISVNAAVSFFTQDSISTYYSLIEALAASVVFMATPRSWVSRLRPGKGAMSNTGGYVGGILRDRLFEVSQALKEIGETTRKVSESLGRLEGGGSGEAAARAVDRVCRKCRMKATCWQFSCAETTEAMSAALNCLKRKGHIRRGYAPRYLTENCCRLDELLSELNAQFQNYSTREGVQRKVSRVRSVLTDQFDSLSMMLSEISDELCAVRKHDEPKARRVRDYLESTGISADRVQAYTDEADRVCVAFTIPNYQVARLHRSKTALDLCGLLEAELDLPQITARRDCATVVFMEKAVFTVEFGAYQIPGSNNRLCGDSYDYIKNQTGRAHFILSDGMGSGGAAAVDSSMAAGLIQQLLMVGISHEAALKMVNSALMIKSGDETLATIDVTTIDLFTGRADFYKAGAAPTFLIKNGHAGYVEASSLPAGILRGVSFEHNVTSLRENDIIVMVSDGVTASGTDWIKSELESLRAIGVRGLCEKLAATAKERRNDSHEDDITVLAAIMRRV